MPTIAETRFLSDSMDSLSRALMQRRMLEEQKKDREQRLQLSRELMQLRRDQYAQQPKKQTPLETAMMKSKVDQLSEVNKKILELRSTEADPNTGTRLRALLSEKKMLEESLGGGGAPQADQATAPVAQQGGEAEQAKWLAEGMKRGWIPKEAVQQQVGQLTPDQRLKFEASPIGKALLQPDEAQADSEAAPALDLPEKWVPGKGINLETSGGLETGTWVPAGELAPPPDPPQPTTEGNPLGANPFKYGQAIPSGRGPQMPQSKVPANLNTNVFMSSTGGEKSPLKDLIGEQKQKAQSGSRSLADKLAELANQLQSEHPDWSRDTIKAEVLKRYTQ